jgi:hypothetical protein
MADSFIRRFAFYPWCCLWGFDESGSSLLRSEPPWSALFIEFSCARQFETRINNTSCFRALKTKHPWRNADNGAFQALNSTCRPFLLELLHRDIKVMTLLIASMC